ncbi:uncharacterized protein TNCV_357871 [Trichonephila clavipes]|nr:uncharacterized protein TNCV_357871 [Trichonephila clavipes]
MDSLNPCPDKELVLPKPNVDNIATNTRFLLISLNKNEMSTTSPFAIHKAFIGIGGEPKSVKKLRSGDLIKNSSAVQTKSFLLVKSFLDSPANITPHKSLNSSRGVTSVNLTFSPRLKRKSLRDSLQYRMPRNSQKHDRGKEKKNY